MGARRGAAVARERLNALHALDQAGLITFVNSEVVDGERRYTVHVTNPKKTVEMTLQSTDVDTFIKTIVAVTGREDLDLTEPFPQVQGQ